MVAIQGLRVAAMPREEAGGRRAGGGESQRRASQSAGAAPPGWHRGPERSGARGWKGTSAGACGPGGAAPPGPGRAGPSAATGGFCRKFYHASVRKAREHFGEGRFPETPAPAPHIVLSSRLEKEREVWDPASHDVAQGLPGGPAQR